MRLRPALASDIQAVAALHADSWRRFYRGAYTDDYLDGDLLADRLAVWAARLNHPDPRAVTIVVDPESESRHQILGFVHLVRDHDPTWGALVDNLHVRRAEQGGGLGSALLTRAAAQAGGSALYLWVQEQNTRARAFYAARGGRVVGRAQISDPGGVPGRTVGRPMKLRVAWADAAAVGKAKAAPSQGERRGLQDRVSGPGSSATAAG
ncbi:GNAT family N-acetyltransferase [Asanoa siamensis]|uniref:N-acetyltransferase domain-containing protein n=1 Tax=Asanoa siamensis TaxID=926357 RepID=A0ABQ4CZU5_9ACTN|nr:GNAT family N-acetyltransferase [Asanoa siamensis]GIF76813.1 hypothetical protein Asi02nite_63310 [Asanoa siamensis]